MVTSSALCFGYHRHRRTDHAHRPLRRARHRVPDLRLHPLPRRRRRRVSKAGGFGVLGAVGFTPEQLEVELHWIDEHVGDKPYGVDIVIPGKYEGMGEHRPGEARATMLRAMVPEGAPSTSPTRSSPTTACPSCPTEEGERMRCSAGPRPPPRPQVEVALRHPKVRLIANALGTPPADVIEQIHDAGPQGRRAVRLAVPGAEAQGRRRRHRHRPGQRGRRPHRRGRLDRALAPGHRGRRAHPGARRRRHRHGPADRRRARDGRAGRVGRARCGSPSRRPTCRRRRSSSCSTPTPATPCASPVVHRQAVPHAAQRLDRGVGAARHPRARCRCRCSSW